MIIYKLIYTIIELLYGGCGGFSAFGFAGLRAGLSCLPSGISAQAFGARDRVRSGGRADREKIGGGQSFGGGCVGAWARCFAVLPGVPAAGRGLCILTGQKIT